MKLSSDEPRAFARAPGEPDRSMRLSYAEGALVAIASRIHLGPLCTQLALLLGARAIHLGWLAALGSLATLGSTVTALVGHRVRSRQTFIFWSALVGRSLWLVPAALLLTPMPDRLQLGVFLLVAFFAQALVQMAHNGWQSWWIADLVPPGRRGRFFGVRNTIAQLTEMLTAYLTGRWYDQGVAAGHPRSTVSLIFLTGAAAAALAMHFFARQREPPAHPPPELSPLHGWRVAWRDRAFRRLLIFCAAWAAATGVVGPFWVAHMIQFLKMSQASIAGFPLLFGAASLVSQPFWGRVADRVGQRPVLVGTMAVIIFLPLTWLPARPDALGWIWFDATVSGVGWPGFNLSLFNLLLGTAPRSGRTAGFALHSMATGAAAFVAGLLGGVLAHGLEGREMTVSGVRLINHHALFALTAALRAALLPMAVRLADHRALRTRALVTLVADKLSITFAAGWRAAFGPVRRRFRRRSEE